MCVGVCVRTRPCLTPHSQLPLAAVTDSKPGERTSSAIEVNEGRGRRRGWGLSGCIQMPVLNCSNRAGYLVWARRLNSTSLPADYCIQPAVFVLAVAAQGEGEYSCHIWFKIGYQEGLNTEWQLLKIMQPWT